MAVRALFAVKEINGFADRKRTGLRGPCSGINNDIPDSQYQSCHDQRPDDFDDLVRTITSRSWYYCDAAVKNRSDSFVRVKRKKGGGQGNRVRERTQPLDARGADAIRPARLQWREHDFVSTKKSRFVSVFAGKKTVHEPLLTKSGEFLP